MSGINKKTYFIVGIEIPEGMTKSVLRSYIKKAIICERGNHLPEDDFFNINVDSISITPMSDNAYKHFFGGKEK